MSKILDQKLKKMSEDKQLLWTLRHTAEHVLHTALQNIYPSMKKAMGPATDEGYYHDFDSDKKVTDLDFPKIEKEMKRIIDMNLPMVQKFIEEEEARKIFRNNPYKLEWVDQIKSRGEKFSIYKIGDIDTDLCSGPHVKSTGEIKAFKLLKVAGAYWHGDEKNKMLTRIYGTCFPTKEELDHYLWQIDEAKKRDHKKLGQMQELFIFADEVGSGLPIYLPKGATIRRLIEEYIYKEKSKRDYLFVWTPHIARSQLYVTSGHWKKYDAMFNPMKLDDEEYVLKAMNCPHHFQIYLSRQRSYRDLPFRIAENGTVYRYEKSGVLNGLFRVRSATIDDTHTFVRHDQIEDEYKRILNLIRLFFQDFGFTKYKMRVSVRDAKNKSKYMGDDRLWKKAEDAIKNVAQKSGLEWYLGHGEAAFYGPKLDIMIEDALGREWQCSTIQLDFVQPINFDMNYTDEHGNLQKPAVLHIAILGSIERFLGILIEHHAGKLPLWIAPVQVAIVPIADRHAAHATIVCQELHKAGIRVSADLKNGSMQSKIREATLQKVPFMGIIGDQEIKKSQGLPIKDVYITVRSLDGKDVKQQKLSEFIDSIKQEIEKKH